MSNINKHPDIDISALEANPDFRADYLYFIRLAATYMQSIFRDVFRARNKGDRKRRKRMYALAQNVIRDPQSELLISIQNPERRNRETLDCLKTVFPVLLRALPDDVRETFENRMKHEHAIFVQLHTFAHILDILREKRNRLEHYEDRQQNGREPNVREEEVINALGRFLLPHLHTVFLGRLRHYQNKLVDQYDLETIAISHDTIDGLFRMRREQRRNANYRLFAVERRRDRTPRPVRQGHHTAKQPWREYYQIYNQHRPTDYREFEFKTRFYFMGEQNFHRIRHMLGDDDTGALSFRDHIEPFYFLTARVNLVLHRYLARLPANKQGIQGYDDHYDTPKLRAIRNTIAHNGLFWVVRTKDNDIIPDDQVFALVLRNLALMCDDGLTLANDCCNTLAQIFRDENYAIVHLPGDETHPPRARKIGRWTAARRQAYLDAGYEIDKRGHARKHVARWMRQLKDAKAQARLHGRQNNAIKDAG
jgi:hypothetical protein